MLLASFAYVNIVYDNQGIPIDPNYYCQDRGIKTYCSGLTSYYSLPNGKCINPKGNLLCKSGWEEIPKAGLYKSKVICTFEGCS